MQAEALHARGLHLRIAVEELLAREAVLRLLGLANDGIAALQRTRIVAAAHDAVCPIGHADRLLEERPVRDVVEVDNRLERPGRRVVRGEHDLVTDVADLLGEDELRHRRAVATKAKLLKELHEIRIRSGLHREELAETIVPGERGLQTARIGANGLRIIHVERCRVCLRRLFNPCLVKRKLSHADSL